MYELRLKQLCLQKVPFIKLTLIYPILSMHKLMESLEKFKNNITQFSKIVKIR